MAVKISDLAAAAKKLPPSPFNKTREVVFCPLLPNPDNGNWGRDCVIRRLHPTDQLVLAGRVNEGVRSLQTEGESSDQFLARYSLPDLDTPQERARFFENVWLLVLGCVDPVFAFEDALSWLSNDELDGIPVGDCAQFLLVKIRAANEEQPGLEHLVGGLSTIRRMPDAFQMLENAYLKGGDALDLLLEGKVAGSQVEMAEFIEKWGAIISATAFSVLRKQAKIQADETATALLDKLIDLALQTGYLKQKE